MGLPAFRTLADAEIVIKNEMGSFIRVGNALAWVRDNDMYQQKGFKTFESYCKEQWGMTKIHAYRQIAGAKTNAVLAKSNQLVTPKFESVARPLTTLPPDKQAEAWQEAVETAPEGKITAKHVKDVVAKRKRVKFNDDTSGLKLGSQAMHHAETAIMHITHIQKNDPGRIKALRHVISVCKKLIKEGGGK
jgi:hypothetical protein